MMKKHILYLLVSFYVPHIIATQSPILHLQQIDEKAVKKAFKKIQCELYWNTVARYAVVGTFVTSLGGLTWYWLYGKPSAVVEQASQITACTEDKEKVIKMLEAITKQVDAIAKQVKPTEAMATHYLAKNVSSGFLSSAKSFLKDLAYSVCVSALFNGLNNSLGPISRYIKKFDGFLSDTIFHDGDLAWFLQSHTRITKLFDDMNTHACLLSGNIELASGQDLLPVTMHNNIATMQTVDCNHHCQLIAYDWNMLIVDLTAFLGFITYKKQYAVRDSVLIAQELQAVQDQIMKYTNTYQVLLQQALNTLDFAIIKTYIQEFRTLLSKEVQSLTILDI